MKRFLLDLIDLLDYMDFFVKRMCIFFTGAMTLVVILQVFFRYVLKTPLTWTEELSRYLLIGSAFFCGSSLVRTHENMYVDFFINKIPKHIRRIIIISLDLLIICFLCLLFYLAVTVYPKVSMRQITPALGLNMFYVQVSVIIGIGLMILQTLNVFLTAILKKGNHYA